jgi:hypothetical protein
MPAFSFIKLTFGGLHKGMNYPNSMQNFLELLFYRDDANCICLNTVSVKPILNDTEVLSLPIVSSPLFSVFGLNPKGPEAFSDA